MNCLYFVIFYGQYTNLDQQKYIDRYIENCTIYVSLYLHVFFHARSTHCMDGHIIFAISSLFKLTI